MPRTLTLSLCALSALTSGALAINQLQNAGFETGAVAGGGHAFTPAPWTSSSPGNAFINYDTWENTGTTGLIPTTSGVFTGATAPEGVRWAGGWSFEEMGQLLSSPLNAGQQYLVSAMVRPGFTQIGSFEFYIGTGPGSPVSLLASFPMANSGSWTFQNATFTAPSNSAANPWFIVKAYTTASPVPGDDRVYMGIDDMFLDVVPAPGSLALLGGAGLFSARRRAR